jgi:hypothetical protein
MEDRAMRTMGAIPLMMLLMIVGCEGDRGPVGPEGVRGEPGVLPVFWDDFEADSIASPPWVLSGDSLWSVRESDWAIYGQRIIQSGNIADGQKSTIAIDVSFPTGGLVTFYGGVNCEADSDFLFWRVDGNTIDGASGRTEAGTMARVTSTFMVGPGTHTIEWSYEKDAAGSDGRDLAVLHAVQFLNAAPAKLVAAHTDSPKGVVLWSEGRRETSPTR